MRKSMKIRLINADGIVQVKVIMKHPMETGQRRDKNTGKLIAAHFINKITIAINDKDVLVSRCTGGISKNPFFGFQVSGAKTNDIIKVSWFDNLGESDSIEAIVD